MNSMNDINNSGEERRNRKTHNVNLFNRRQMTVSGVIRVDHFNENMIVIVTEVGQMTIEGLNLHISKLSLETGDMNIDGDVTGIFYSDAADSADGKSSKFLSKLFK